LPVARTVPVVDSMFGLEVPDPYRWMEGAENQEMTAWLRAHGEHAARELAKIPGREQLHQRIRELGRSISLAYGVAPANGRLFYEALSGGDQLAKLVVREPGGETRVLLDPAALSTPSLHIALNAWSPSFDGTKLSYVLSAGGGEVGALHVMDVTSGKELPEQIPRIWGEAPGAWLPDNKRFFYTQLAEPQPGVDPMKGMVVRLHTVGQPVESDPIIVGRGADSAFPLASEEWPFLWVSGDSEWVLLGAAGARSEERLAIARISQLDLKGTGKTPWQKVAEYADGVESADTHGDRLYLRTYKDAPNRRILSVPLSRPLLSEARVEVAEDPDRTMTSMTMARDAMYLLYMADGRSRVSRWAWRGAPAPVALPIDGSVYELASEPDRDGAVFQVETWQSPSTYYSYDPKARKVAPIGLGDTTSVRVDDVVAEEVEALSADGTAVPLSILHLKRFALDGTHPAILYAYGGYGSSQLPSFGVMRLAWLERGGVFAIAHVRGGGEKGRRWQEDGSRDKKMNGVRDFIACSEYLISHRYTSRTKLAATASSMGGVLLGRALTERPDLFAAVNLDVGIVNPLRILAAENGANQKAELGDPETEAGYRALVAMDPYHHVQPNTAYPAVIFTIGLNDHRVAPWMTAKMAARLLASTTSGKPILVRVDADAGHGIGSTQDQSYEQRADLWSFFLQAFGEPGFGASK
jgi:prolyl oligopeptidase